MPCMQAAAGPSLASLVSIMMTPVRAVTVAAAGPPLGPVTESARDLTGRHCDSMISTVTVAARDLALPVTPGPGHESAHNCRGPLGMIIM